MTRFISLLLLLLAQVHVAGQPVVTTLDVGYYTADVNGSVTLEYKFTPNGAYLVTWCFAKTGNAKETRLFTADGKTVTSRENISLVGHRRIQVINCQETDSGAYIAWIWTSTMNYRVIIKLNVARFPKIWVETPRVSVQEGSALQVPCYGYKMKEPFTWSKLKGPVLKEGFTQKQNDLVIANATFSHQGIWECKAQAWGGYRVDVLYLTVHCNLGPTRLSW